jgi:membrane protease YdiL (CAAX protease family)
LRKIRFSIGPPAENRAADNGYNGCHMEEKPIRSARRADRERKGISAIPPKGTAKHPVAEEHQYGLLKILAVWLAASLPFNLLIVQVVPALAGATGASEIVLFWLLLPLNAAWLIGLSLWIVRREEGTLKWETAGRRLWLNEARGEEPDAGCRTAARIPLGVFTAYLALIFGLSLPAIVPRILYNMSFPSFTSITDAGSPELAGWWGWIALVAAAWLVNTFAAEELLFRGVLLPRMKGVFGRFDGLANGVLYALYYIGSPLLIPFRFLTGLAVALLAGGLRSNRKNLWIRSTEGAMVLTFAVLAVTSPRLKPIASAPALPMISAVVNPEPETVRKLDALPEYIPNTGNPFALDLRDTDLSGLVLNAGGEALLHSCFNTATVWPGSERLPDGFDPQAILAWGKNPGLGLRELHARGVDGRGVGIAIIDQGLYTGHPEYAPRLRWYEEITHNLFNLNTSFHASTVASMAVGRETGVAPGADLYFISSNDVILRGMIWELEYDALGIRRVVELNRYLPEGEKIRVISISIGASPPGMSGARDFSGAVAEAEAAGIYTLFTNATPAGYINLAGAPPLADPDDPRSYDLSTLAVNPPDVDTPDFLLVPVDSRTFAGPGGPDDYYWCRTGGLSWMMPYAAGLYALALQADPALTPERFWQIAFDTAVPLEVDRNGTPRRIGKLVNPQGIIAEVAAGIG